MANCLADTVMIGGGKFYLVFAFISFTEYGESHLLEFVNELLINAVFVQLFSIFLVTKLL